MNQPAMLARLLREIAADLVMPGGRCTLLDQSALDDVRALPPGSKLPPEPDLAAQLGPSRNLAREAVKALAVARVLEIRRGDGTYVTSLQRENMATGTRTRRRPGTTRHTVSGHPHPPGQRSTPRRLARVDRAETAVRALLATWAEG